MKSEIRLAKIGNSQGIRLSKQLLRRFGIEDSLEMETTQDAIVLRPIGKKHLSWAATYAEMAVAEEDWSEWDATADDGLENGN